MNGSKRINGRRARAGAAVAAIAAGVVAVIAVELPGPARARDQSAEHGQAVPR